jgi:hypothetical protein
VTFATGHSVVARKIAHAASVQPTIVTYSQSTAPTSPHFADQTRLFGDHGWNRPPFCADDVEAAPGATLRLHG